MSEARVVEMGFKPFEHQRAAHALRLTIRFMVLVWHRRAGKTVFAIMELILAALSAKRPSSRYGYLAPFLKQSKAVAWDYLKSLTRGIPGVGYNESELAVDFPNGARIRLFGADNPDAMRGLYFDGVVLDEVADMRPQVWGEIIRPALADRQGWAIFIGTPKGVNLFSELYFAAMKGLAGWAADLRRASETGVIPDDELEQAKASLSPQQYAQEFDCDFFAAVEDTLITLDRVLEAEARVYTEADIMGSAKVLGVDVARYGGDRWCLFPRQGLQAFTPKVGRGVDTMALAGHVVAAIDKWQPDATLIDMGGMGAGVYDRVRQLGYSAIAVDFGGKPIDPRFENKRAEMWWNMADWLKTGSLPEGVDGLHMDLTAPKISYANKRGKMQLESKDEMRARGLPSPDVGDGLACTFAVPVAPKSMRQTTRRVATDFDPLEWR